MFIKRNLVKQLPIQPFLNTELQNLNKGRGDFAPIINICKLSPLSYRYTCMYMYFKHLIYTDLLIAGMMLGEILTMEKSQLI